MGVSRRCICLYIIGGAFDLNSDRIVFEYQRPSLSLPREVSTRKLPDIIHPSQSSSHPFTPSHPPSSPTSSPIFPYPGPETCCKARCCRFGGVSEPGPFDQRASIHPSIQSIRSIRYTSTSTHIQTDTRTDIYLHHYRDSHSLTPTDSHSHTLTPSHPPRRHTPACSLTDSRAAHLPAPNQRERYLLYPTCIYLVLRSASTAASQP